MNFKAIIRLIPWIIVAVLVVLLWLKRVGSYTTTEKTDMESTLVLQQIERLGKLELVKYNYKEVVEVENVAKRYLDLGYFYIPGGQDQKAILIAQGEAVACIDLQKIDIGDIEFREDTVIIRLPQPEICYYKVNLENSKFYDLKTSTDRNKAAEFVDEVYSKAEAQVKEAALESGILEDAEKMSTSVLKPILEKISGFAVVLEFSEKPDSMGFELN